MAVDIVYKMDCGTFFQQVSLRDIAPRLGRRPRSHFGGQNRGASACGRGGEVGWSAERPGEVRAV